MHCKQYRLYDSLMAVNNCCLYNIIVSSVEYWSRGGDYVRAGTLLSLACLHALIYLHACILAYGFYSFYAFYAFYGPLLDLQAYPAG
jgi:hypothetical protein